MTPDEMADFMLATAIFAALGIVLVVLSMVNALGVMVGVSLWFARACRRFAAWLKE